MTRYEYQGVTVPIIIQQVGGDLRLRGRESDALVVEGELATVEHLGAGQPYLVRAAGDVRVTAPDVVPVSVQAVGGDASITGLAADCDIQSVGGDLSLRDAGALHVSAVGGDARLKRVAGDVTVEAVGGDATIRDVEGAVAVLSVGADLFLRDVGGDCLVERVGADLVLSLDFVPGREYRFSAGSDILCRIHPDTHATFDLPADTVLQLDVPAEVLEREDAPDRQTIVLGDGSAHVRIGAANRLRLVGEEEDYMVNFGAQIEDELEARLSHLEARLSQQLEGLDERIQATTIRFASQAEKLAERAQREALRAAERVRRTMGHWDDAKPKRSPRKAKRAGFVLEGLETRSTPPSRHDPVTEEERLMILKMVQDGKITIEEAERLLAALEG
ncbi:MAG: hypothetical protein KJ047_03660 [Anaerolineae bacterium]|nr:hypothetical protein [Anaerolineae bacterium]MEB2288333.1 hypothetical protein [Anaerolineae bacterium]